MKCAGKQARHAMFLRVESILPDGLDGVSKSSRLFEDNSTVPGVVRHTDGHLSQIAKSRVFGAKSQIPDAPNAMECPGGDRFERGTAFGSWHSFVYRPVNEQTFWPKGVPCSTQNDHQHATNNFPLFHVVSPAAKHSQLMTRRQLHHTINVRSCPRLQ